MIASNSIDDDQFVKSIFRCNTAHRFLPSIEVNHAKSYPLDKTFDSFLIPAASGNLLLDPNGESIEDHQALNSVRININSINENRDIQLCNYSSPAFKKSHLKKTPSISYDLASIRFNSMKGSTIWHSNRIKPTSFYFKSLIHNALAHAAAIHGNCVLHGGFFTYKNNGFLMPGESCSGKSTVCILAMLADGITVSDDLVIVANNDNCFQARAFRSHFLARKNTYALLPSNIQALCSAVDTETGTKYHLGRDKVANQTRLWGQINAIVLPEINQDSNQSSSLVPFSLQSYSRSSALKNIMKSIDTTALMPGLTHERTTVTKNIVEMVSSLPCLKLVMNKSFLNEPINNTNRLLDDLNKLL